MTRAYVSVFAVQIGLFVDFKRAMGATYSDGEYYLGRFDRYCATEGITAMTRQACEGFVTLVDNGRVDASRGWVPVLRGFARWMHAHGDPGAYVLPGYYTPRRPRPETYLLAEAEIEAFFTAAAVFTSWRPWPWQARAFFGLMHSCGLRTCEARRLNRIDIDLDALMITVAESKGPRTRVLPVTTDVAALLADCDDRNSHIWPAREPLFVSATGTRLGPDRPADVFKQIWTTAGLTWPDCPPFPRPYDFRHHFAYANLQRWAAAEIDTTAQLAYLARYMGHTSPQSTLYYLHVSPDFLANWDTIPHPSERLLPQVGFDD